MPQAAFDGELPAQHLDSLAQGGQANGVTAVAAHHVIYIKTAAVILNHHHHLIGSQVEVTPGLALRGLAPPSVVGRVEIGVSREGPAIFVGLDYPF